MVSIGFKTAQSDVDWATLSSTWELADEMPELDSGWLFDHMVPVLNEQPAPGGTFEGWTIGTALAARTRRLRFGHLVLSNTFRHPALLARMAATLDHVAGPNRLVVGLGTGWLEVEHRMYGWELPSMKDRFDRLAASVRTLKGMWQQPDGFSQDGPYPLDTAICRPAPVTKGGPPVWLGTQGKVRGLRILAETADGWNVNGPIEEYPEKRDALLRHCEDVGRDPAEIEISAQFVPRGQPAAQLIEEACVLVDGGVGHLVFGVRAADGPASVEQLVRDVVRPLRDLYGPSREGTV